MDRWIAYRFGLIAARIGEIGQQTYRSKFDLTPTAWRALAVLVRFEPCSASELAARSRADAFKVSRAIDLLVGRGLIRRNKDPADQRRAFLTVTKRGRNIHDQVAARAISIEKYVTSALTATELSTLWKIVDKLDAKIVSAQRRDDPSS